jgi:lipid A disaccharide synthetase
MKNIRVRGVFGILSNLEKLSCPQQETLDNKQQAQLTPSNRLTIELPPFHLRVICLLSELNLNLCKVGAHDNNNVVPIIQASTLGIGL